MAVRQVLAADLVKRTFTETTRDGATGPELPVNVATCCVAAFSIADALLGPQ